MPPPAPSGSGFFTQTQRYASAGPPVQHSDILDHLPPGAFGPFDAAHSKASGDLFSRLDADGSGVISREEFEQALGGP